MKKIGKLSTRETSSRYSRLDLESSRTLEDRPPNCEGFGEPGQRKMAVTDQCLGIQGPCRKGPRQIEHGLRGMDCAGAYRVFSTRGAPDNRGRSRHEQDSTSLPRSCRRLSCRYRKSFPAYADYRRCSPAHCKRSFVFLTYSEQLSLFCGDRRSWRYFGPCFFRSGALPRAEPHSLVRGYSPHLEPPFRSPFSRTHRHRHKWKLSQCGNGVVDSLPLGSGNPNVT